MRLSYYRTIPFLRITFLLSYISIVIFCRPAVLPAPGSM
ncbi:hypothetical protein D8I24_1992 [Cupriavidus necator H850]|nr:hypothetical protein D8I24_1992 [Cupriavidus necator H850]